MRLSDEILPFTYRSKNKSGRSWIYSKCKLGRDLVGYPPGAEFEKIEIDSFLKEIKLYPAPITVIFKWKEEVEFQCPSN